MTETNWQRLYVPPPPEDFDAPCIGRPHLFDIEPKMAAALTRHYGGGNGLRADYAAQIDVALSYCAQCPLAIRDWCENTATIPRGSRASIITGGKVYSRGRVVWSLEHKAAAERAA